jgi:general secretion pathway protein G
MNSSVIIKESTKFQRGFSLLEILIALTLVALTGTFVVGKIMDSLHEGKLTTAKIQMNGLSERFKEFYRHCSFYPTTDQGIQALITKPTGGRECKRYAPNGYLEDNKIPQDPWDTDFNYESDGRTFNIWSYGGDSQEGGSDKDADIYLREPGGGQAAAAGANAPAE